MEELSKQTDYAKLYASARKASEQQRDLLTVGDREALPKRNTHRDCIKN